MKELKKKKGNLLTQVGPSHPHQKDLVQPGQRGRGRLGMQLKLNFPLPNNDAKQTRFEVTQCNIATPMRA